MNSNKAFRHKESSNFSHNQSIEHSSHGQGRRRRRGPPQRHEDDYEDEDERPTGYVATRPRRGLLVTPCLAPSGPATDDETLVAARIVLIGARTYFHDPEQPGRLDASRRDADISKAKELIHTAHLDVEYALAAIDAADASSAYERRLSAKESAEAVDIANKLALVAAQEMGVIAGPSGVRDPRIDDGRCSRRAPLLSMHEDDEDEGQFRRRGMTGRPPRPPIPSLF